ncbi:ABC transporter permease subunit [Butyrivibrio sp. JL13D10]|uniref:ABC transporter permease subunit n=1 Tax=Butyrivibrio sp. JL13D10 TaxID=3236815 RepID=UPI0038B5DBD4
MRKNLENNSHLYIFIILIALFAILTGGDILSPMNVSSLFLQNSHIFILVAGMTICMCKKGNLDISIGSFICFVCAMGGVFLSILKLGTPLSIILLFVVGILWGCLVGFIISYCNVPAWVATLGGYLTFRGLGTAILNNFSATGSITGIPDSFIRLFSGKMFRSDLNSFGVSSLIVCILLAVIGIVCKIILTKKEGLPITPKYYIVSAVFLLLSVFIGTSFARTGGIPVPFLWMIITVGIPAFWLDATTKGRKLVMLGSNPANATLGGVDTKKAVLLTYVFMALCSTLSACIVLAKFHAASSYAGVNFEMDVIAACVIGGVSVYGGKQEILGAVMGAVLIGIINLGLSLLGINMTGQMILKGIIILLAISLDIFIKRQDTRR